MKLIALLFIVKLWVVNADPFHITAEIGDISNQECAINNGSTRRRRGLLESTSNSDSSSEHGFIDGIQCINNSTRSDDDSSEEQQYSIIDECGIISPSSDSGDDDASVLVEICVEYNGNIFDCAPGVFDLFLPLCNNSNLHAIINPSNAGKLDDFISSTGDNVNTAGGGSANGDVGIFVALNDYNSTGFTICLNNIIVGTDDLNGIDIGSIGVSQGLVIVFGGDNFCNLDGLPCFDFFFPDDDCDGQQPIATEEVDGSGSESDEEEEEEEEEEDVESSSSLSSSPSSDSEDNVRVLFNDKDKMEFDKIESDADNDGTDGKMEGGTYYVMFNLSNDELVYLWVFVIAFFAITLLICYWLKNSIYEGVQYIVEAEIESII